MIDLRRGQFVRKADHDNTRMTTWWEPQDVREVLVRRDDRRGLSLSVAEYIFVGMPTQPHVAHVLSLPACLTQNTSCRPWHVLVNDELPHLRQDSYFLASQHASRIAERRPD